MHKNMLSTENSHDKQDILWPHTLRGIKQDDLYTSTC